MENPREGGSDHCEVYPQYKDPMHQIDVQKNLTTFRGFQKGYVNNFFQVYLPLDTFILCTTSS